ncbi:sulfatase-like hydrolase/transferase [Flagellimonas pacifica]|uniref:Arylsulfatase A n=1 Tax=Flagellimonas pacifica TaxID=1247520 RepID=A0A285MX36_9FLAO|nr:sulfatase-like hydrolase/transferase [Allomuricauda parva]SNZ01760.1 Arylsulfatase A [Allomuricauda parva]
MATKKIDYSFLLFLGALLFMTEGFCQTQAENYTKKFLNGRERTGEFEVRSNIENRPNIFMITVDMISPDVYSPSRELKKHINTPNLDKLAQAGTTFNKAFCTAPVCGPSRATILTGRHQPYLTNGERAPMGMIRNLKEGDIIFPQYLKKSGYNIKHVGKWHVGAEKFIQTFGENQHGWDRWAPPLLDDELYIAYLDKLNVKPQKYSKEIYGKQHDRHTKGNSLGGWIVQEDNKPFPLQAHYSVFLAELAKQKLDAAKRNHPNKPVFLQLEFFDPHQPYSIPAGFEDRYEALKKVVKLPVSYQKLIETDFAKIEGEDNIYEVYRQYWGLYNEEMLKDYIIGHLLQMEVVDKALGVFFNYLEEQNLWDDAVIMLSADHGDMNGRMGMADKGVYFQPDIFRVPLYIKEPGDNSKKTPGVHDPVSSLDIGPTLLGYAGIKTPKFMEGESLSSVINGGERSKLHHVFQTGWHVGVNYGFGYQFQINGTHWFYGYNISTGTQELYDIDADDQINHFHDKDKDELVKLIVNKVAEVMQADNRWLGYWATFRLHNAAYLPKTNDDMQMFKPKDKH